MISTRPTIGDLQERLPTAGFSGNAEDLFLENVKGIVARGMA